MAHYTWYNLSPQGKTISSVTFSILGSAAESLTFSYIGLCTFTYAPVQDGIGDPNNFWSVSLIVFLLAIIIVGRIITVFSVEGMFKLCKNKSDINFRELVFISYGGMIRGAIAFGLVLKLK
jgi:NhaP-type Na+/H+ or K+/H+ antiporter